MIRNYPGFSQGISGARLAQEARLQAWAFGTTFLYMRQAKSLSKQDQHYRLALSDGGVLTARTVIIATGATYRRLHIPRPEEMQGRGVFYGAATSEALAMRGRNVFVAGGGNSAGQAALHLAKWANHVTVLVRAPSLAASMSDYLIRQIGAAPNVEVRYGVQVADGTGTGHLQSLVLEDTETDIVHAIADGKDINDVWVDAVTTTRPAVATTTTIRDTATIMTAGHFRHLPVAGDTGLLGVADITDVCRVLIGAEQE